MLKPILSILFIPFFLLHMLSEPVVAGEPVWTCEEMMKLKFIHDLQLSPDGQQVLFTATEPIMNETQSYYAESLYVASTIHPEKVQTLISHSICRSPQWSPDGRQIAFIAPDTFGNHQIWLKDLEQGKTYQLTFVKGQINHLRWSPQAHLIAFSMFDPITEKEEQARKEKNDAYVVDDHTRMNRLWGISVKAEGENHPFLLTPGPYSISLSHALTGKGGYDWSPDGQQIVITLASIPQIEGWKQASLFLIDIPTKTMKPLGNQIGEFNPVYSPDGQWIAYIASQGPPKWPLDFRVFIIPSRGGVAYPLAVTFDCLPTKIVGWSADSQIVYVTEAHQTGNCLWALTLDGKQGHPIHLNGMLFSSISLNALHNQLAATLEDINSPPEVHLVSLLNSTIKQISHVNDELMNHPKIRTEIIKWFSTDGAEIEGLLTYPIHYHPKHRYPLVLIIHGGPSGVFAKQFIATPSIYGPMAVLAQKGCLVLRCNIRGSCGYGKAFRHANYRDWAGMDYQDLMSGIESIIKQGIADETKLGVVGWSYGGFLATWMIARTNHFKAAIIGAGISNCLSFAYTTDIPSFLFDYFGIKPSENASAYVKTSPIFHLQRVVTPTLIQHGEQDKRVPIEQSYELYHVLKQLNVPVQMIVYPRTSHYPQEPKLMLDLLKRRVDWFSRFLELP